MLEEYDWTAFSVVSTRHHGYQDFLSVVEGLTDGSFIGWEKKNVVMLNLTDDPGGARARRLLKENEAQVRGRRRMSCHFPSRPPPPIPLFLLPCLPICPETRKQVSV